MTSTENDIGKTLGLEQQRHPARRWLIRGTALAVLVVIALVFNPFSGDEGSAVRYETRTVERGELHLTVTATGTLEPVSEVEVGSELSGTIAEVLVDFNDEVSEGQILARLDTTSLESRIAEGRAALQQAQAKVQEAEATELEKKAALARCRELSARKMCSDNDLDAADAAYKRARASVASARAQVALARATLEGYETNLKKATIRSPINGIVLDRQVEPGQTVAASLQTPVLFNLAEDLAQMELIVAIDEADIGNIRDGLEATFSVDAYPDRTFHATIKQVRRAPQTVDGVVTYETVLSVDNSDLLLLPGMTATAEIMVKSIRDALLVPNAALRYSPPEETVKASRGGVMSFMPRPPAPVKRERSVESSGRERHIWLLRDGRPEQVGVTIGDSDGINTVITDGALEPGMAVIIDAISAGS